MRVLHVGWGFTPLRVRDGLIAYAEDVMAAQAANGHEVAYFFSGRHYPRLTGPRLKRWQRGAIAMYEVINSPIIVGAEAGTAKPDLEISESRIEASFARVLGKVRPDVVHFEDLQGLPSSLIDVTVASGVPSLMTLQDYFPLCATTRLFDADGQICKRRDVGFDCVACNANAPRVPAAQRTLTLEYEMTRAGEALRRIVPRANFAPLAPLVERGYRWVATSRSAPDGHAPAAPGQDADDEDALAEAFQRRRELNVQRLSRLGRVLTQSERVAQICVERGVSPDRVQTLPFTLSHIEALQPRSSPDPSAPITFGTLNGCASPSKGARILLDAVRRLSAAGLDGRYRLRVLGSVDASVRDELAAHESVELAGRYSAEDLDGLLDGIDVGVIPSVWEEAFGYVGLELLAKGVPLIANPLGGIPEYAVEGETAWLNRSCSGAGLAAIIGELVHDPARVLELHRRVVAARDRLITPMERHLSLLEGVYRELLDAPAAVHAPAMRSPTARRTGS